MVLKNNWLKLQTKDIGLMHANTEQTLYIAIVMKAFGFIFSDVVQFKQMCEWSKDQTKNTTTRLLYISQPSTHLSIVFLR